jgi:tight adherence protein B
VNPAVLGILITVIFVGGLLAGSFVYWTLATRREAKSRSMARRLGSVGDSTSSADLFQSNREDPLVDALGYVGRHLDDLARQTGGTLTASGLATQISLGALIGGLVLGVLVSAQAGVFGLLFGGIPWLQVRRRAQARNIQLSQQLPDALDLISRSLQAGHGIAESMRLVAEEMPLPVAREFGRVYEENNLGRDFRDCMTEMATRNPHNFDLRIVVSATLLQRETGGNLIEILDNISNTIRGRFIFKGKVRALTAEVRASAFILGSLPFVIGGILMVLRPGYLTPLLTEPNGRNMLVVCGLLFCTGVMLMRGLSQVEA